MSKAAILGAIQRGLKRGPLSADAQATLHERIARHPRHLIPGRTAVSRPAQIALFQSLVEREFGTVDRVPDVDGVPEAIVTYLAGHNLPSIAVMAPHPALRAIPWSNRPLLMLHEGRAEATDQVSIQHGWAGVAETGTLMLPSAPDRPVTLNLLADTAIVILRTSRIVGPYEDAWDLLRSEAVPGPFMPRNVMLITGPSRSADIEQTLELGAHGPRRLHIVLIEDDPAARP